MDKNLTLNKLKKPISIFAIDIYIPLNPGPFSASFFKPYR